MSWQYISNANFETSHIAGKQGLGPNRFAPVVGMCASVSWNTPESFFVGLGLDTGMWPHGANGVKCRSREAQRKVT
jgi:hypothetical protein